MTAQYTAEDRPQTARRRRFRGEFAPTSQRYTLCSAATNRSLRASKRHSKIARAQRSAGRTTARQGVRYTDPARRTHMSNRTRCGALLPVAAALAVGRPVCAGARRRADALHPVLREEPDPLRQFPVEHLHHRSFRDLLLPRDRAAPGARGRLRRERLPARQLGAEARPRVQGAADPVQDEQRVPAAERHSRARRRKASARSPSRRATASSCRWTSRPTCSTG